MVRGTGMFGALKVSLILSLHCGQLWAVYSVDMFFHAEEKGRLAASASQDHSTSAISKSALTLGD